MPTAITIVSMPRGAAPERVRRDWIGLTIPLPSPEMLRRDPPLSCHTGSHFVLRLEAIAALKRSGNLESARFWEALPLGKYLQFPQDCCEIIH